MSAVPLIAALMNVGKSIAERAGQLRRRRLDRLAAVTGRTLDCMELEERVLFSAAPLAVVAPVKPHAAPKPISTVQTANHSAAGPPSRATASLAAPVSHELAFVDGSIVDRQKIFNDLSTLNDPHRQIDVVLLSESNGIGEISAALSRYRNLDAVHFISHGTDHSLDLGGTWLNGENVGAYAGQIAQWSSSLRPGADLLFYGCDLAAGAEGRSLLQSIQQLTRANVAASTDATGAASLGGNWKLEYQLGSVHTTTPLTAQDETQWNHLLSTYVVTSTADTNTPGTLRWAINRVNADSGLDTISFDIGGGGLWTINLASGLPTITNAVIIDGTSQPGYAGAPLIVINGAPIPGGSNGIFVAASSSTIKGLAINGFVGCGILVLGASDVTIQANYVGVGATGTAAAPNGAGISIESSPRALIGGTAAAERNVVSGNWDKGIFVGAGSNGVLIEGNYIGTNAAGTGALPNGTVGVDIDGGTGSVIGGTTAGAANVIADNTGKGIVVSSNASADAAAIEGNAIYGNGGLGIDLNNDGVTPNTPGGPHSGPNNLQNFPVLTSAIVNGTQITISGSLNSTPSAAYRIEFFASPTADATGNGQGKTFLGFVSVTTDAAGNAAFSGTFSPGALSGQVVSATATDFSGNTSEFAADVTANAAPTVAKPAAASPSPVYGTTTTLSVQGADDGGEANLKYAWAETSGPTGASYSANGNNAAKNTTVTFSQAGAYTFQATITDAGGLSATSSVNVTVNQVLTSVTVSPAAANMHENLAQQFSALALDQFGQPMASQPGVAWSVAGVGTINSSGLYTSPGGAGTATVTATAGPNVTAEYTFNPSNLGTDVTGAHNGTAINATSVTDPVHGNVLSLTGTGDVQISGLFGQPSSITLAAWVNLTSANTHGSEVISLGDSVILRLDEPGNGTVGLVYNGTVWQRASSGQFLAGTGWHFVAFTADSASQTETIYIDGVAAGTNTVTGAPSYSLGPNSFIGTHGHGMSGFNFDGLIGDVQVYSQALTASQIASLYANGGVAGSAAVTVYNAAPTVATPAAAAPSPVTGTKTNLSVLGADDGGEANLTYTWAETSGPAAVTYNVNGTNAAKNTTVTFSRAGSYTFQATITDAGGLSTTSSVSVTVNQTFTSIAVSPVTASLNDNQTQQFSAAANDQFGMPMASQPAFTWTLSSGVGSLSAAGLYTAPNSAGVATVAATSGAVTGTATISIDYQPPTVATPAAAAPSVVTGSTTSLSVLGADDGGESTLTYTWTQTAGPAAASFSDNGDNAAKNTTVTFSQAGNYIFQATITDFGGKSATSSVNVTVKQTLTSVTVSPSLANVHENQTQQFNAAGLDQFGQPMASQPSFAWSVAGVGTISGSGLYTSPGGVGTAIVTATAGSGGVAGSAPVTVYNAAPTVATPAAATPSPVTGATTSLSVLGADDGGEANLTYTWAETSGPAAATYSVNATNAAKNTTVTFSQAGNYTFQATITDAGGLSTTSSVDVTVNQTLTSIAVSPATASLVGNQAQQFTAAAYDQFGMLLANQPAFTWSVAAGMGSIDGTGLYTAPAASGTATIDAASGALLGSAEIIVTPVNAALTLSVPGPQRAGTGALVFSPTNANAIVLQDAGTGVGTYQVALTCVNGAATLGNLQGITFLAGNGRRNASMVFQGSLSAINAALNGLQFTPTSLSSSLQVSASDAAPVDGIQRATTSTIAIRATLMPVSPQDSGGGTKRADNGSATNSGSAVATVPAPPAPAAHDSHRSAVAPPAQPAKGYSPFAGATPGRFSAFTAAPYAETLWNAQYASFERRQRPQANSIAAGGKLRKAVAAWSQRVVMSPRYWEALDACKREAQLQIGDHWWEVSVSAGLAAGSVGCVFWLLRATSLLAAAASSMPVWTSFDALPVLEFQTKAAKSRKNCQSPGEEAEPVDEAAEAVFR